MRKWTVFAILVAVAVACDLWTKRWAAASLPPGTTVHPWGDWLPLTLGYNRGIAFGLHIGGASRVVFTLISILVLPVVGLLHRATQPGERLRTLGLALMFSGATGNLIDRAFSARGVVDFIGPYDLGFMRWPVFNFADVWVVVGTFVFAIVAARPHPKPGAPLQEQVL